MITYLLTYLFIYLSGCVTATSNFVTHLKRVIPACSIVYKRYKASAVLTAQRKGSLTLQQLTFCPMDCGLIMD